MSQRVAIVTLLAGLLASAAAAAGNPYNGTKWNIAATGTSTSTTHGTRALNFADDLAVTAGSLGSCTSAHFCGQVAPDGTASLYYGDETCPFTVQLPASGNAVRAGPVRCSWSGTSQDGNGNEVPFQMTQSLTFTLTRTEPAPGQVTTTPPPSCVHVAVAAHYYRSSQDIWVAWQAPSKLGSYVVESRQVYYRGNLNGSVGVDANAHQATIRFPQRPTKQRISIDVDFRLVNRDPSQPNAEAHTCSAATLTVPAR